ncbi:rhodanese-like domain-containing protein [Paraglaciecola aquimarina]|uniref:Rhodanese-like domain-containing protein n=1 Tax=Paraglaciecola aquimarina TaxID=1235557 RepID=A0ABU3SWN7_9ALTE|nr:rhodanese-like domain-containing protein [Paraglaciecola aquimarina]MDU0354434.1 rhodanese-like domain-containing protein [Paraglaciecola aquimarina]
MLKSVADLIAEVKQSIRCTDAQTATRERAENKGWLIDVREPSEHLATPAEGAINIPRGLLEMKMMELEKDAKRAIYLHCATSARAALGAEQLQRVGYKNVSVITCNMDEIQRCCTL